MIRRRSGFVSAALLLVVLVAPTAAPAGAAPRSHDFDDVGELNPFHDDIHWMVEQGFASGYADGLFHPTAPVSRQAMVQMLWKMSGSPAGPFPPEPFPDVEPGHFYTAITWAYAAGVIGGFADGTFRPTRAVSRQAMASLLHRLSGIPGFYSKQIFTDVSDLHPFAEDIWWWSASGQADGYSDGTFRPSEVVSRQATAAFFSRFYQVMGGATWPYHAHSHTCTDPVTAEQQQAADDLVAAVNESITANWPTRAAAEADGYHQVGPTIGGFGGHLVKDAYRGDGDEVNPLYPEVLMADDGPSGMVRGAMFVMDDVGVDGPRVGGCLTMWHAHENVCFTDDFFDGGNFAGIATYGGCPGTSMVRITPQMLHVFIDGRANPFEGLET
jgi:hypothetical protein